MKTNVAIAALALTFCLGVSQTQAKEYKTAYINMEKVFVNYYLTVQENVKFAKEKRDFQDRVGILTDELKNLDAQAKKLKADSEDTEVLTEEARNEAKRKLRLLVEHGMAKNQEFGKFREQGLRALRGKQQKIEEELIAKVVTFVREYCKINGYELVYDINGKTLNRMPTILLYPEELEITQEVMDAVNRGHEEELASARKNLKAAEAAIKSSAGE